MYSVRRDREVIAEHAADGGAPAGERPVSVANGRSPRDVFDDRSACVLPPGLLSFVSHGDGVLTFRYTPHTRFRAAIARARGVRRLTSVHRWCGGVMPRPAEKGHRAG